MADDEYDGLSLDERREKAIENDKAYGKTRLKEDFRLRPGEDAKPAFFYKSHFGGKNPCYRVSDCVPIREHTSPLSEKQMLALKINSLIRQLKSKAMVQARLLSDVDRASICFLDTETTGLDGEDQIIELAIVDGYGKPLFDRRFKPSVAVSDGALYVHGISNEDLAGEAEWTDAIDEIQSILIGKTAYIFNSSFDRRMLINTCKAFDVDLDWLKSVKSRCMMDISAAAFGSTNKYGSISLADAVLCANVEWRGKAHSALSDTLAAYSIFDSLIRKREGIILEISELEQSQSKSSL